MRLGYDALCLHPPYSGVQVAVEQTALALAPRLGAGLTVFAPAGYAWPQRPGELPGSGPRLVRAPVSGANRLARIAWEQLCLPAAARAAGVELLYCPAYVMPLRRREPTAVLVHDLLALTHPEWCKRANVWHFRLVLPPTLRQASRIITPSATVAEAVRAWPGVAPEKVRAIPLGIEERFRPASVGEQEKVRAAYGLSSPYLLVVGNIEPKKNLTGTLQIFGRLVREIPHQLVVAGRVGWGDPRSWSQALEELPPGRVKLLGYVRGEDLPALYSGADLFLQLSWYEGFGIPPLEAMACGTATVVSNRGALPEISGPGAVVVDPADQSEAARVILNLLGDEAARQRQAEVGRTHAAAFTWSRHVQALLALFGEVLSVG